MALAADDLLADVITPRLSVRGLDRLAVDDRRRGACFTSLALSIKHELDAMDRLEQEPPRQLAKPAVDGSPMTKIHRQHPPEIGRASCRERVS
jgi:hypothetical protein